MLAGNIGTPLISCVENSKRNTVTVVELSSFQLELIETFRPNISLFLNLTPDHLDRHRSMETYGGAKARIVAREKKENREIWTVEGLVHPGLKRTLFTFKQGSLFGVELQYEYPDRTIEWYNQRMGEIRRYFDAKFGTGKLVSRSRDSDTDVIQTLVGYQWMVGATMLELFYFSAQHDELVFRTISVDYKAL